MRDFTKMTASDWWAQGGIPVFRSVVVEPTASNVSAVCELRVIDEHGHSLLIRMNRHEFLELAQQMITSVDEARKNDIQ